MRCYIGDRWNAFGNAARSLPSGRPHTITRRRHTKHGGQICNARGATVRNSARGGPMYLPNADHFRNSQFASTVAASAPTSCLSDRLHRRHIGARRALSRDGAGRAYPGLAAMPTPMPFSAKSLAQLALIPGPPPTIRATSCAEGLVLGFSDRAMFHTRMCVARETSAARPAKARALPRDGILLTQVRRRLRGGCRLLSCSLSSSGLCFHHQS